MTVREQRALQELLGEFRGDPAFHHLEERAQGAGHLEDTDYARLLGADENCESVRNLRRHVLFCGVCAEEFLKRAAPASEEHYVRVDESRRFRRRVLIALLLISVAFGTRGFFHLRSELRLRDGTTASWAVERCATGRSFGKAEERFFAQLRGPQGGQVWIYAFLRDGESIHAIGPDARHGVLNPQRVGVVPERGWVPPEGFVSPELIVFVSPRSAPPLEDPLAREEVAKRMEEMCRKGHLIADVLKALRKELLPAEGWIQRAVVER